MDTWPKDRSNLYGAFAFSIVVVSCHLGYAFTERFYASEWMVAVSFGLSALYVTFGIFSDICLRVRGWGTYTYFAVQCALVTAAIWVSPLRGFYGILVLPLASQSVFEFGWRGATVVVSYLFGLCIAVWGIPYGWDAALQAVVSYSAAFVFTTVFTIITKQALLAREREENLRRELEAANLQLRAQAEQAGELATTRERNRLAREIHDGVGHYLTVVKTQLDAAAALVATDPARARAAIDKAARLAHDALEDVRRSVGTLRTDASRPPLPEALRDLTTHASPVPEFRLEGTPRPLSASAEHALFRSAQEGLTNLRKHAHATAATLTLDYRDARHVRLEVTDNGRGANGDSTPGFGLQGLRERAEILGGRVTATSRPTGGFTLAVELPG